MLRLSSTGGTVTRRYYPVFLDLGDRLATVVGDGAEAARKATELLEHGARLRLVTTAPGRLSALPTVELELRPRPYRRGDLAGSFLAVCEREVAAVHEVWREARDLGIPLNVVDDPDRCSFIAPAVVRRGDLAVAISTAGRAPALAVRLREELERRLGSEHARFLEIVGALRTPLAQRVPQFAERRRLWYRLVDSDVIELLAAGDEPQALARVQQITGIALEKTP